MNKGQTDSNEWLMSNKQREDPFQQQQQQQPQAQPQFQNAHPHGGPSAPPPGYCPIPPPNPPKIIAKPKYNDVWATALFAVFMAGFAVFAALGLPLAIEDLKTGELGRRPNNSSSGSVSLSFKVSASDIGGLIAASVGTGVAFSVVYFMLMLKFPGPIIKFSYFVNVLLLAGMAAYTAYLKSYIACAIFAVLAFLVAVTYWGVRDRIPFSQLVLETVCKISIRFNGTLFVAFGGIVVSAVYAVVWIGTLFGMMEWLQVRNVSSGAFYAILVILVFMSFWFNEVVRNTIHMTACGTFATYFFMGMQQPNSDRVTLPSNHTTAKSLGRALTTSFGSICFGSLLISIIRTLKFIAHMARTDSDGNIICCFVATCLECILGCLADILDYFNKYAYTEIAIYGKPYCEAGKDVFELFKYKGFDLIINDCLIGYVLAAGSFLTAALCALAGFLFVYLKGGLGSAGNSVGVYVGVCLISAFIGMWMFLVLLEVVDSGTAATFVCLAEDPATIQRQQPRFFAALQERYPDANWGIQSIAY
ncbi:hypothetical protein CcCBS67573_g02872 [Chytriomyces confervae]|uniref:Protein PNS1 n=1 Tax=Chytriomyces confervae TaxID=246404 RepID=A0A507FHF2_9FUNG|nr:hypothetical protein CcCBS67573_g02872 [Chytriomyces confervae]